MKLVFDLYLALLSNFVMAEIPVDVSDVNEVVIQISNEPSSLEIILIIATFCAVGVALLGVLLAHRNTKKSIELAQLEVESKIRPWITLGSPLPKTMSVELPSGNVKNFAWDDFMADLDNLRPNAKTVSLEIPIENVGMMPAKNLKIKSIFRPSPITKQNVTEKEFSGTLTIMPSEKTAILLTISADKWAKKVRTPLYIGVEIKFENNTKTELIGRIWKLGYGQFIIVDSW